MPSVDSGDKAIYVPFVTGAVFFMSAYHLVQFENTFNIPFL